MSKEKISAEKFYDKHGGFVIDDKWDAFNFAEAYAQHVTEQLQRDKEEMRKHLAIMAEEFSHPDYELWCDHQVGICCCDQIEMLEKAERLGNMITPKPEK